MTRVLHHPLLGAIRGKIISDELFRCYSLPYASIPRRFARSELLRELPHHSGSTVYDASTIGPASVQLPNAAHNDAESNQLPTDEVEEQEQSEDCLRLTLTCPLNVELDRKLPVVVFIHGGAFFLGSGERRWLDPTAFCMHALKNNKPVVFVSVNYRLGLLGFLHSPEAPDLMPANNALHDQIRAFEWIRQKIAGFGGDHDNITAMGQSAGGESLSLHNLFGLKDAMYKRSITLSGTLVTMPAKTPEAYQSTFRECAEKMDIAVKGRSSKDIAKDMITVDIDKIRTANFVGSPCTSSEVLPYKKPTMQLMRSHIPAQVNWLESQIVSSCTYDGSISYIMTSQSPERRDHAASFVKVAREVLQNPDELLDIYCIRSDDGDGEALRKICLFESDAGFVSAAISQAIGMTKTNTKTFLQIFDLGNPFNGLLPEEEYASHTWDIVALLGAYEDRLTEQYAKVVKDWRNKVLQYITDGTAICDDFRRAQTGLTVNRDGVGAMAMNEFPGTTRRARLWRFAEAEKDEDGLDYLWEDVCRRWLDQGK